MNYRGIPKHNRNANIHSVDEFMSMDKSMEVLIVDSNTCNDKGYTVMNMSSFSNLKVFEVGDYSCSYVEEVKLIGLNRLERVVIGTKSFTKYKSNNGFDKSGKFYLKNCERLRELKMGCVSFNDYFVCEIENVPSLEVIEMGELDGWSVSFYYASLELKSYPDRMR